jgi:hypothetical protein
MQQADATTAENWYRRGISSPPMGQMKRREFMPFLSGTVASWPLAVRAQPALPVVAFLHQGRSDGAFANVAAFTQ